MATVKLLHMGTVGPKEMDGSADDFICNGLQTNAAIDMNSNQFTNLPAATASGEALEYGQSGAQLAGLSIITNPLDMNSQQINEVANGSLPGDAVNLSQLDSAVINGGQRKELLLHETQLNDVEGVLAAIALVITTNPVSGDTITITDGTTTRTYGAGTGGDVQYTIGGSVAATMANLAQAIAGDGSGAWSQTEFTAELNSIDVNGVVCIIEDDNDGVASKLYGTWATPADCQAIDYDGELHYEKKTTDDMPSSSPANSNFGIRRTQVSLSAGEIHYVENDDADYGWDDDADIWHAMSGGGTIPEATSGAGGAVKGKITVDRDYGLLVATGAILRISLATNKGLGFDGGGDLQGIADTGAGMEITASGFAIDLATNPGLQFSSGDLDLLLNGTTLEKGASGVSVKGLPSLFEVNAVAVGATVTAANLDDLTDGSNADSLHTHSSVGASRVADELTAEGTLAKADAVEWGTINNRVRECRADTTAQIDAVGVVEESAGIADTVTGTVVLFGIAVGVLTGATVGQRFYIGSTGGLIQGIGSLSSGDHIVFVGTAVNATDLFVQPQYIIEKI